MAALDPERSIHCPREDELAALAEGVAPAARVEGLHEHIAGCTRCYAAVAALVRDAGGTTDGDGAADTIAADPDLTPALSLPRGTELGRYLVLGPLGAGGMGVVYEAHDRELDRKVALKVIRGAPSGVATTGGGARLLREAQALARLSHPNVVAVHDVGTLGDRVWVAMERVRGETLGAWARARRRGWQESLRVLIDAARGVAAAHEAGLVHRDLKPENVMIADDGRVRVLDFGLAHGRALADGDADAATRGDAGPLAAIEAPALVLRLTRTGAVQGTPAYMAPEQWEGREAGPAADLFAWSVMAWELLFGERPFAGDDMGTLAAAVCGGRRRPPPRDRRVPAWLRRAIERGLERDPARRWPDMQALLVALTRGRSQARLRRGVALTMAAALAIGGAWLGRRAELARRADACVAEGATIAEIWDDRARERLRRALLGAGVPYAAATAERVLPRLDAHAAAWAQARAEVCLDAEVRGRGDDEAQARALWCLDERRMELDALVDELTAADAVVVARAVPAVAGLASLEPCRDAQLLARLPAPPQGRREALRAARIALARVSSLERAGRYDVGLEAARAVVDDAAALAWPPLLAASRAALGSLLERTGQYADSEAALEDAYFEAIGAGALEVAADASIQLIYTVGERRHRFADARRWSRHAAALLAELGDDDGLLTARRLIHHGLVVGEEGAHDQALALISRALTIQARVLGERHPEIAITRDNLGVTHRKAGDHAAAKEEHLRALAIEEEALGAGHPQIAATLNNLALAHRALGEVAEAHQLNARALSLWEAAFGPEDVGAVTHLNNLATTHRLLGDHAAARGLYQRALALQERAYGAEDPTVAAILNNLAIVHGTLGEHAEALRLFERSLALKERLHGPSSLALAGTLCNLAETHDKLGDHAAARPLYDRARAIFEASHGPDHVQVAYPLVGLAAVALAEGRAGEAVPLAERAVELRERAGAPAELLADARFALARALWDAGRDRARALALARDAHRALAALGAGHAEALAGVDTWLQARGGAGR